LPAEVGFIQAMGKTHNFKYFNPKEKIEANNT
jgi:hypothetical protein